MARIDNLGQGEFRELLRRISSLENATPLSNTSVERGRLRMYSGSELLIEDGNLKVTGTATVNGQLVGTGTFTWTGPTNLNGPTNINNTLTVGSGSIKAGPITIDKSGPYAGRIASSTSLLLDVSGNTVITSPVTMEGKLSAINGIDVATNLKVTGNINVTGNQTVLGSKSFRMDHPTKPGHWIQHGSTESPVSGTEYWGTGSFDAVGKSIVELPAYFEALNKPENRTVQLTAVGRPYMVGADPIVNGKFTAYGKAGRDFTWTVKAERFGGDFEIEPIKESE